MMNHCVYLTVPHYLIKPGLSTPLVRDNVFKNLECRRGSTVLTLIMTGFIQQTTLSPAKIDAKIQRLTDGYHMAGISIPVINDYEID